MLRLPISVLVSTLLLVSTEIVIDGFVTITHAQQAKQAAIRLASGDHKEGYESPQYQTDSLSLEVRSGSRLTFSLLSTQRNLAFLKKQKVVFLSRASLRSNSVVNYSSIVVYHVIRQCLVQCVISQSKDLPTMNYSAP